MEEPVKSLLKFTSVVLNEDIRSLTYEFNPADLYPSPCARIKTSSIPMMKTTRNKARTKTKFNISGRMLAINCVLEYFPYPFYFKLIQLIAFRSIYTKFTRSDSIQTFSSFWPLLEISKKKIYRILNLLRSVRELKML